MRWECRYSSCEMMYLEVGSTHVRCWLHHSEANADEWSFESVLGGEHDAEVRLLFGEAAVEELNREVQRRR